MTDEKKLEAIERIIKNSIKLSSRGMIYEGEIIPLSKEILTALKQFEPEPLECKWKQWPEGDTFDTDCGNCFSITEGSIEENDFKHCPYCGKLIKVINKETIK